MKRKQRNANLNVNTAWSRGFRIPVYCGSTAIFFVSIPYGGHWQALNAKVDSFYFEKEMYVFLLFQTAHTRFGRLLKNCAQGRHAVLRRSRQCSHMLEDAALVVLPDALPDDLIPVFDTLFGIGARNSMFYIFNELPLNPLPRPVSDPD